MTRLQQQREGEGEAESSLARTRSWVDEAEAMYEEEGVAAPAENVPDWVGPSGNGSSVRGVDERVVEMDVAPEQSRVRREDPELRGGGQQRQCQSGGDLRARYQFRGGGEVGQVENREVAGEGIARGQGNNGTERPLEPIRFRGQENKFSNFYPCNVEVFGREFSSSEVAYQWRKAVFLGEAGVAADIGRMWVAREAKWAASRAFGKRGWYPVTVGRRARMSQWEDAKVEVMRQILRAKARGCAEFVAELRRSGERPLHKAVPKEEFWGIGQGSGRNWLGVLLMDLRIILDDVLHSNNRDDGIDLRPESGGPVRPM